MSFANWPLWSVAPTALLTAIALSLSTLWLWTKLVARGLPPVPLWIALRFAQRPDLAIELKLRARAMLGRAYTLFIGTRPAVILGEYGLIHETFVTNGEHCSSRPKGVGKLLTGNTEDLGVMFTPHWKEHRRFALLLLRDLGMGKIDLEPKIIEEARALCDAIACHRGQPLDIAQYMHMATCNIISGMVLGARHEYSDPAFSKVLGSVLGQVSKIHWMALPSMVPVLRLLPGDPFGYHRFMKEDQQNDAYFRDIIRQHKDTLDEENPRDFIDVYLMHIKGLAHAEQKTSLDEKDLIATVRQLYGAGADTTAAALLWAWLYMINRPDVQVRAQREIDEHIGSRAPSLKDRANMKFTEAILTEVLRVGNVANGAIPHVTDSDMNVAEFKIPKGTVIMPSSSDVHLDEATYQQPREFNPDRFIDDEGAFQKPKKFLPFGIGRRQCLGENLARAEMFLLFTSVLQRYSLRSRDGKAISTVAQLKLTNKPVSYTIVFSPRQDVGK